MIFELRQYTMRPGRRDELIELFDREFVESQEVVGIRVVGQFRDLDDADRFVWLRGFSDLTTRVEALQAFYYGPVWQAHRDAANATMLDSDDVLMLRPLGDGPAFPPVSTGAGSAPDGLVTVAIHHLDTGMTAEAAAARLLPLIHAAGAEVLAVMETERAENGFPQLPVRTGERVLVWVARFADTSAHNGYRERLSPSWPPSTTELRLTPTPRSRLR